MKGSGEEGEEEEEEEEECANKHAFPSTSTLSSRQVALLGDAMVDFLWGTTTTLSFLEEVLRFRVQVPGWYGCTDRQTTRATSI